MSNVLNKRNTKKTRIIINMSLKKSVIGVDEVGRGSLAGPVIASASIINENFMQIAIKDSKQFSERQIIKVAEALISSKIQ